MSTRKCDVCELQKGTTHFNPTKSRFECNECDSELNIWGTPKYLINSDEFCPDCEREVPFHYDNCPTRLPSNARPQ